MLLVEEGFMQEQIVRRLAALTERVEALLERTTMQERWAVLALIQSTLVTQTTEQLSLEVRAFGETLKRLPAPKLEQPTAPPAAAYLTEREVAQYLKVSLALLRRWRMDGKGPAFVKIGRLVRYPRRNVEAFLE